MKAEPLPSNVTIDLPGRRAKTRLEERAPRANLAKFGGSLWRNRTAVLGLLILLCIIVAAVLAPWIADADPTRIDLAERLRPPFWLLNGTPQHLLGTDHLGRDVLGRALFGARISLFVGLLATAIAGGVGIFLGMVSGYFGGKTGEIIMRAGDIQQSFPFIALAIAIVSVLGPGLRNTVIVLGIGGWVLFARIVRAEVLSVREKDYIEAARSIGADNLRIMFRHILPNISSPIIVISSFTFALMIVTEASLSFIGLGVQPPESTWGLMLSDARTYMQVAWWLPTFPGLAIIITVLGANLLGDWLRDVLDPRLKSV